MHIICGVLLSPARAPGKFLFDDYLLRCCKIAKSLFASGADSFRKESVSAYWLSVLSRALTSPDEVVFNAKFIA